VPRQGRAAGARCEGDSSTELKVSAVGVLVEGQQVVRVVRLVQQRVELLWNDVQCTIVLGDVVERHPQRQERRLTTRACDRSGTPRCLSRRSADNIRQFS
jgi:hypothetical protein